MIVLDATVAIKLVTLEPGADRTLQRISGEPDRFAPDWIGIEVASALARKVKEDGLSENAATAARSGLDHIVTHQTSALELLEEAFGLSLRLGHAVYDCLYLALALRLHTVVVTHDAGFAKATRRADLGSSIELLTA